MSGLFRWSADTTSTLMSLFSTMKSSAAIWAATTDPAPARSAYGPDLSLSTPNLTVRSAACATAECATKRMSAAANLRAEDKTVFDIFHLMSIALISAHWSSELDG